MPARERIPDELRERIEAAIRDGAGTASCRGLARQFEVSTATIRRIADAAGMPDAFNRAATVKATEARLDDLASRRANLADRALALADHMLTRARSPHTMYLATKDDIHTIVLDEPAPADVRQLAVAFGTFAQRHVDLIKYDTKEGAAPGTLSLVDQIAAGFGLTDPDTDDYPPPEPFEPPADDDGDP